MATVTAAVAPAAPMIHRVCACIARSTSPRVAGAASGETTVMRATVSRPAGGHRLHNRHSATSLRRGSGAKVELAPANGSEPWCRNLAVLSLMAQLDSAPPVQDGVGQAAFGAAACPTSVDPSDRGPARSPRRADCPPPLAGPVGCPQADRLPYVRRKGSDVPDEPQSAPPPVPPPPPPPHPSTDPGELVREGGFAVPRWPRFLRPGKRESD